MDSLRRQPRRRRRRPERPAPRLSCTAWWRHPITRSRAMRRLPRRTVPRSTAAFHLDRLVEVGLLDGRAPTPERALGSGRRAPDEALPRDARSMSSRACRAALRTRRRAPRRRRSSERSATASPCARRSTPKRTRSDASSAAAQHGARGRARPLRLRAGRRRRRRAHPRELPLPRPRDPPHAARLRCEPGTRRRASSRRRQTTRMPALEPAAGRCCVAIHRRRPVERLRRSHSARYPAGTGHSLAIMKP